MLPKDQQEAYFVIESLVRADRSRHRGRRSSDRHSGRAGGSKTVESTKSCKCKDALLAPTLAHVNRDAQLRVLRATASGPVLLQLLFLFPIVIYGSTLPWLS